MTPEERLRQQFDSDRRRHDANIRSINRHHRYAVVAIIVVVAAPVLFELIRAWIHHRQGAL